MAHPLKRYVDDSVKQEKARPLKDIQRDISGKDVSNTYNLQGVIDYGNGAVLGETFNQGLRTRKCAITSMKAEYVERARRAKENRQLAREAANRDDRYADLEEQYYSNVANDLRDGALYQVNKVREDLRAMARIHEYYIYSK